MKTYCNLNPAYKNTSVTITNLSSSVPPEQKSVNRHKEKRLDKDLEDPCRKFDPFAGYLSLQKLRRRFKTHLDNGHIEDDIPIVRKLYFILAYSYT